MYTGEKIEAIFSNPAPGFEKLFSEPPVCKLDYIIDFSRGRLTKLCEGRVCDQIVAKAGSIVTYPEAHVAGRDIPRLAKGGLPYCSNDPFLIDAGNDGQKLVYCDDPISRFDKMKFFRIDDAQTKFVYADPAKLWKNFKRVVSNSTDTQYDRYDYAGGTFFETGTKNYFLTVWHNGLGKREIVITLLENGEAKPVGQIRIEDALLNVIVKRPDRR